MIRSILELVLKNKMTYEIDKQVENCPEKCNHSELRSVPRVLHRVNINNSKMVEKRIENKVDAWFHTKMAMEVKCEPKVLFGKEAEERVRGKVIKGGINWHLNPKFQKK